MRMTLGSRVPLWLDSLTCDSSGTISPRCCCAADIKRVQEWLDHHSTTFTLDIYGHLMSDDHEASLRQVEAIFATALRSAPGRPSDGPAWRGRPLRARSSRSDNSRTLPLITWAGT
jgi:hypothetical protein